MIDLPTSGDVCASARDVRGRLINAAGEIFATSGYDAATVKEITDRAGVNVASVNYYFRDKFNLYLEVLRTSMAARPAARGLEGTSPEERLTSYVVKFMSALIVEGRPGWYSRIMVRELAQPTAALPQVVDEIIRPDCEFLKQLVIDVAGGCPGDETLRLLVHSVLGQCTHWKIGQPIFAHLWPELRLDSAQVERIARHIAAFSLAGIRAVAAQAPALSLGGKEAQP